MCVHKSYDNSVKVHFLKRLIDLLPAGFVLSLGSEWQQLSSGNEDFSLYSGWSQQCYSSDGLDSSSNYQIIQPTFQDFGDQVWRL